MVKLIQDEYGFSVKGLKRKIAIRVPGQILKLIEDLW